MDTGDYASIALSLIILGFMWQLRRDLHRDIADLRERKEASPLIRPTIMLILGLCVGIAVALVPSPAKAQDKTSPDGREAKALAYNNLGIMYQNGEGVPQDYSEALRLFRLAAEQGLDIAQYNLGNMYQDGEGVPQDNSEALRLFRLAAEQGLDIAQYNLGLMYYHGQGVPQDYSEALRLFRLAADQGLALAQYNLGLMYYHGQGVPQDYARALKWFNLTTSGGSDPAGKQKGK